MPSRTLTYYFTLQSPWSYLGHAAAMDIVRRHGLRLVWKPMNLARVFPDSGGLPLAKRHPKRQAYRDIELQRWRLARQIPLTLRPAFWPIGSSLADRVAVALAERSDPEPFVRRAFGAVWVEDANLADESTVAKLLASVEEPAADVLQLAASDEVAEAYERNAAEALDAGVFGAPTYILDGEPFWGQDRLGLLEEALTSGRPAFRA